MNPLSSWRSLHLIVTYGAVDWMMFSNQSDVRISQNTLKRRKSDRVKKNYLLVNSSLCAVKWWIVLYRKNNVCLKIVSNVAEIFNSCLWYFLLHFYIYCSRAFKLNMLFTCMYHIFFNTILHILLGTYIEQFNSYRLIFRSILLSRDLRAIHKSMIF